MKITSFLFITLILSGIFINSYSQTQKDSLKSQLDSKIQTNQIAYAASQDSIVTKSTALAVLGEIGLGSLLSIASAGLVGGVSSQLTDDDYTYAILLTYLAYSFGHSLGVYIISKNNNKATSFLELFGVSVLSAAVSAYAYYGSNQKGIVSLTPLFMPLLGPLIYTNLVYPPQPQKVSVKVLPNVSVINNSLQYGVNLRVTF